MSANENDFTIGETYTAKIDAYAMTNIDGKWVPETGEEHRLLTKGNQYKIIRKGRTSITVLDDSGDESMWTFTSYESDYTFPFYTKEEHREHMLEKLLK